MARQKRMDRFLVRVLAPVLCRRDFCFRLQQRNPSDFFLISDDVGRLQRCDHWLPPFAEIMDRSVSPLGQVATSYSILPWLCRNAALNIVSTYPRVALLYLGCMFEAVRRNVDRRVQATGSR
jgi:hypothetical protein